MAPGITPEKQVDMCRCMQPEVPISCCIKRGPLFYRLAFRGKESRKREGARGWCDGAERERDAQVPVQRLNPMRTNVVCAGQREMER